MREVRPLWRVGGLVLMAGVLLSTGCTYAQNRGNDALDFLEIGVTASRKPHFALYVGLANVITIGYAKLDGTFYGIAHRRAGAMPVRYDTRGVLLWGEEQLGFGDFDVDDADSPQPWRVGVIGLAQGSAIPRHELLNCPKLLHLGWVGLSLNGHLAELADFFVGWTTTDIMGDDASGQPQVQVEVEAAAE